MALHNLEGVLKPRKRPIGLLLDTAPSLNLAGDRWRRGVEFASYGCDGLSRGTPNFCDEEGLWVYDDAVGDTIVRFGAFGVYATQECSTLDVDMAYLEGRLDDRWMAMLSAPIASELEVGGTAPQVSDGIGGLVDTPTLRNSATTGTASAGTVAEAVAAIEYALAVNLHGAAGYIHVAPFFMPLMDDFITMVDGQWRTFTGHTVIADAGYIGAPPADVADPSPYSGWIYGSGPVAFQVGAPRTQEAAVEGFDQAQNRFTARKVAEAITIFDPCSVVAAEFALIAGS